MIELKPIDLKECVDVIFKWIAIKMAESSSSTFHKNVYDFFQKLFEFLIA